ncbi:MAG: gliding motility protein GldN [Bacteroidales bacterium]|nr:gliding motility protein GldN [Candidatus Sodaliphilus fimicaballi]
MKTLKLIFAMLLVSTISTAASAQVVKKNDADRKAKEEKGAAITGRQQSFYEVKEASDADLQWMKVIYRKLDLTKGKNSALYYPEEPNADGQSLFFIIMRLLADNKISAYEYLDGREMFTDDYKIKVAEMLDRFHIMYSPAKGSTDKNPKFSIEDADIPGNEILSYYIIERWEFDTRSNQMKTRVDALCPVLHRMDEFGGEAIPYPMFWVKLNDIRPFMAQQYVFTDDDNNLPRHSLDDFFKLNLYTGEIYKTKNMRNQSLRQQFPEDKDYKHAQDSIEARLKAFNKELWVPSREELQARAEAKAKLEAEQNGEDVDTTEATDGKDQKKEEKKSVKTKRGSKSADKKDDKKSSQKNTKIKERKPKETKVKSSSPAAGTRSVRNRKK